MSAVAVGWFDPGGACQLPAEGPLRARREWAVDLDRVTVWGPGMEQRSRGAWAQPHVLQGDPEALARAGLPWLCSRSSR